MPNTWTCCPHGKPLDLFWLRVSSFLSSQRWRQVPGIGVGATEEKRRCHKLTVKTDDTKRMTVINPCKEPLELLLLTLSFRPTFTPSTAWRRSPYWSPSRIHSFRALYLMTTRVVFGNKRALGHSLYKYFQPQMVQPSRVSSNKCDFDNGAQSQFPCSLAATGLLCCAAPTVAARNKMGQVRWAMGKCHVWSRLGLQGCSAHCRVFISLQ